MQGGKVGSVGGSVAMNKGWACHKVIAVLKLCHDRSDKGSDCVS